MLVACAGPEPVATIDRWTTPSTFIDTSSSTSTSTTSTTTTTPSTTTSQPPTSTTTSPIFEAVVGDVDTHRLGHSYTTDCPVAPDDVVLISLNHWGFDGQVHDGAIVVARAEGDNVVAIFERLFEIGYPIESVVPIGDLPQGTEDDDPDYNNTSGLHCRLATGSTRWSEHSRGLAIDINPFLNPFITPNILWPENSGKYLDRSLGEPGMIAADDEVVRAFEDSGWLWGGYWESIKDYQHFSVSGR